MIRASIVSLAVSASALLGAGAAHAATVTFNGWAWGNGNLVATKSPMYIGDAGAFSVNLAGAGVAGLDGVLQSYCVDLEQSIAFGEAYGDYSVVNATSFFGQSKAKSLARLISFVFDHDLFASTAASRRDDLSTALQLAVWNLRYDGDDSLASGSFKSTYGGYASATTVADGFWGADALLDAAESAPITRKLWVLQSANHQDQLVWQPMQSSVPEPASLALVGLGLAGAFAASRRKAAARLSAGA